MKFIIFKQIFYKTVVFWIICSHLFCNANNFRAFFLLVRVPKMWRRREKITKSICFIFLLDSSGYKRLSIFPLFAFELTLVSIWTSERREEKISIRFRDYIWLLTFQFKYFVFHSVFVYSLYLTPGKIWLFNHVSFAI